VKKQFKTIFMGTPDFAVPSLNSLSSSDHTIARVVTQPDRPKGRGRSVSPPPVKSAAKDLGLAFTQVASLKTSEIAEELAEHQPDFIVVVAFGNILPKRILEIPKIGTINVHASLLPKYRGPAPINWAIINGESQTGITTMLMDENLDTGDILLTAEESIQPDDTTATLRDRMARIGSDLLVKTLNAYAEDRIHPIAQDHKQASYAPMLKKQDGRIDWQKPAQMLDPFVRGMTPWPGAFTFHESTRFKIFRAKPIEKTFKAPPGTVLESFPGELVISTGKDALKILEIQGPSGKRLMIEDFLRGYTMRPGTILK
jgi:methionyl-tRNA formyltransferase